jgi:hypothetical protein
MDSGFYQMKRIEIKIELIEKDDGGLVLKNRE